MRLGVVQTDTSELRTQADKRSAVHVDVIKTVPRQAAEMKEQKYPEVCRAGEGFSKRKEQRHGRI